ncbi:hypothetical protein NC653_038452 [Populus alba x Populus x berolinensis]|uniref:Uncharacterized protein n=1 Tax=Populus alba x Populus x berolinensis TaxID=444605 RepID=A0AAD6LGQ7_9ROSI|nr:hypothetical protein NC653_038452 [Populus alba x Populus x berolinensis]
MKCFMMHKPNRIFTARYHYIQCKEIAKFLLHCSLSTLNSYYYDSPISRLQCNSQFSEHDAFSHIMILTVCHWFMSMSDMEFTRLGDQRV